MDYQNGKIYIIRNLVNALVYVGSTTQVLSKRMADHRGDCKKEKFKSMKIYQALNELGRDEFNIELVEVCPCESLEHLRKREGHFIREYDSYNNGYNGVIAGRTHKEYVEDNKEKVLKKVKEWKENNRDVILDKKRIKNKIRYTCEVCSCEVNSNHKHRHERTLKHQKNLIKIDINT
jgi:group I intron endonuclease